MGDRIRCRITLEVDGLPARAESVDRLARLQLDARGRGCELVLCGASDELRGLIELMGLSDVLPELSPRSTPPRC